MARLDGQRFADLALNVFAILRSNKIANESYVDAFIRIIGLKPNMSADKMRAQSGDLSSRTNAQISKTVNEDQNAQVSTGQKGQTVVDALLKSQDDNKKRTRQLAAAYIENLLVLLRRWGRVQRGQQIRRIERQIGTIPTDPFDPTLIGGTPVQQVQLHIGRENAEGWRIETVDIAETVRKVNEGLKEIETSKLNKSSGQLTLQLSLYNLILEQISLLISNVPQDSMGALGGAFISILKAPVAGLEQTGRKIEANRRSLAVELTKLQAQSSLNIDGIVLDTGETFSLQNVLQGLLFLAGKLEYKCKNCKFFSQGERISDLLPPDIERENAQFGTICVFSFEGGKGLPAVSNFSCKEVWKLIDNDYWLANDQVIEDFLKAFYYKEGEK